MGINKFAFKNIWQYIVMIILVITLAFSVNSCHKEKAAREADKISVTTAQKVDGIKKGQPAIVYREKAVYPNIDNRLAKIEQLIKENSDRNERQTKEDSIDDIAHGLTLLGYSTAVAR